MDMNTWKSKQKVSEKLRKKIKQYLNTNKSCAVLIEQFGDNGYHSFIYKKKLRKYNPIMMR